VGARRACRGSSGGGARRGHAVLWALSSAVFADSVVESALVPTPSHELDVMAAALDEAVPCEWQPEGCWEDVMQ